MLKLLYFLGFIVIYYLFSLIFRGIKQNNIDDIKPESILVLLMHYCGIYAFFGSELTNMWSAGHSILALGMVFISPIFMIIIGVQNIKKSELTIYHKIIIGLSFGYILILGLLLVMALTITI